jgi:hypothetical protein
MDPAGRRIQENEFIHQRLTRLGTFEGLLFVANHYGHHPYILPISGLVIALSVHEGIRQANRRLTKEGGQIEGWRRYIMPGTIIPKTIALAWVALSSAINPSPALNLALIH